MAAMSTAILAVGGPVLALCDQEDHSLGRGERSSDSMPIQTATAGTMKQRIATHAAKNMGGPPKTGLSRESPRLCGSRSYGRLVFWGRPAVPGCVGRGA